MGNQSNKKPPLIYSCSGCSSAAQLANYLAVKLDRKGLAEMSCIAGVGGDIPSLVRVAKSGRAIVTLDGCPLQCAQGCLRRHGIQATHAFTLSDYEIKKMLHQDFAPEDAARMLSEIETALLLLAQRDPDEK